MVFQSACATRIATLFTVLGVLAACGSGGGSGGESRSPASASSTSAGTPATTVPPAADPPGSSAPAPAEPQTAGGSSKVFAVTPQNGGAATLDGVGRASFPPNALASSATAELRKTESAWVQGLFEDTAVMFQAVVRAPYELRITLGAEQPVMGVDVELIIPPALRAQASGADEVRVMAVNIYESEDERLESVEIVDSRARPADAAVRAQIAPEYFQPNAQGQYEAHVFLALTPTAPDKSTIAQTMRKAFDRLIAAVNPIPCAHASNHVCAGASLARPIDDRFPISSNFGPRLRPVPGASTDHKGIDFSAPPGTPVKAAASGKLEIARFQTDPKTKAVIGWGYFVVIRHDDGSATLYGHLTPHSEKFAIGSSVQAGDVIALSGNSGTSSRPHLHFEYAPSGKIFVKSEKVNPEPCLERLLQGLVTVQDNGYEADDAFTVSLNGSVVCKTTIGASNTCALGDLRAGRYKLSVLVSTAPDDIGTYEAIVDSPKFTLDGAKRVSGSRSEGTTIEHTLVVAL